MDGTEFLPQGFMLPDGTRRGRVLAFGSSWQIVQTSAGGSALLVLPGLMSRWLNDGLITEGLFVPVKESELFVLTCRPGYLVSSIQHGPYPRTNVEARAFALALREARKHTNASFHDAVYLEQFSLLLPTCTDTDPLSDDSVLGLWLSGGVNVAASSGELPRIMTWLTAHEIDALIQDAGLSREHSVTQGSFVLPGRPMLEQFFNEHVIDVVRNEETYRRMGIGFPSPVLLYGPPGCGKTFAIDKLVEFLKWPSFSISSGTIGSSYIHETSRKIAGIFDEAGRNPPSIVVIDEMDAFLSDRMTINSGIHHVEEVSEFLRRIPEAPKKHVLVAAMTNRLEAIDPAVLRRGRFDHVIEVTMPTTEEVSELLSSLFEGLPLSEDVNLLGLAERLSGLPLSDSAFVVKESGRLSVRNGKEAIDSASIESACESLFRKSSENRRIGF